MHASDDLFRLIQSLGKGEKRHFKLAAAQQRGDKAYVRLFDAIARQKKYDEKAIRKQFTGRRILNQFAVAKHALYNLVLRSLREYHAGKTVDANLRMHMEEMEILIRKGLHRQAHARLLKARKLAESNEKFAVLLELLRWQRRLQSLIHASPDERKELHKATSFTLEKLRNILQYQEKLDRLFALVGEISIARTEEQRQDYYRVFRDDIFSDVSRATSREAKWHFHTSHVFYHRGLGNYLQSSAHAEKAYDLIRDEAQDPRDLGKAYRAVSSHYNLIVNLTGAGRFGEALKWVRRLRELYESEAYRSFEGLKPWMFTVIFLNGIYLCTETGAFATGRGLIPPITEGLEKYDAGVSDYYRAIFYFNFVHVCIGAGNYKEALKWLNLLLSRPKLVEHVEGVIKILNIMVHFELGNHELLEYAIKSTYKSLLRSRKLYGGEKILLSYMRKFPGVEGRQDLVALFRQMKTDVEKVKDDPLEKPLLRSFPFHLWLESKISGKDFGELTREAARPQEEYLP